MQERLFEALPEGRLKIFALSIWRGIAPALTGAALGGTTAEVVQWSHPYVIAGLIGLLFNAILAVFRLMLEWNKARHQERTDLLKAWGDFAKDAKAETQAQRQEKHDANDRAHRAELLNELYEARYGPILPQRRSTGRLDPRALDAGGGDDEQPNVTRELR